MLLHLAAQSLQRLVQRLIAETKRAIVHRYHILRSKFSERSDCFLRIHVHLPTARRLVSADRQERNFDRKTRPNFFESSEVSTITAMKNRPLPQPKVKATEPAVAVVEDASAPVMARRESDGYIANIEIFPFA